METVFDKFVKGTSLLLRIVSTSIRLYQDTGEFAQFLTSVAQEVSGGVSETDEL